MSNIEVLVKPDRDKPRTWRVSLPANVAVKRLLQPLIARLKLKTKHSSSYRFVYKLTNENGMKLFDDNKSLSEEGVEQNDVLELVRGIADGGSVQEAIDATRGITGRAGHFLPPLCSRDRKRLAGDSMIVFCPVCERPYHDYCWRENGNSCSQAGCTGSGQRKSFEIIRALYDISMLLLDQEFYLRSLSESDYVNESEKQQLKNLIDDINNMSDDIDKLDEKLQDEYYRSQGLL